MKHHERRTLRVLTGAHNGHNPLRLDKPEHEALIEQGYISGESWRLTEQGREELSRLHNLQGE